MAECRVCRALPSLRTNRTAFPCQRLATVAHCLRRSAAGGLERRRELTVGGAAAAEGLQSEVIPSGFGALFFDLGKNRGGQSCI